MKCQEIKENIYLYLDKELEDSKVQNFKQHLNLCPLCQMAVENEKGFDSLVRSHVVSEEAPYELREAVVAQLDSKSNRFGFPAWLTGKPAMLTAVFSFIMVFVLAAGFLKSQQTFPLYSEAVSNHLDYLKGGYPLEIKSNDIDEVLAWFEGKLDFAVQKPHINLNKVKLIGARLVRIKDSKAAYFMFEKDGQTISAFSVALAGKKLPQDDVSVVDRPLVTIMAKNEKGYSSVLCLHKVDHSGCLFVSSMPEDKLKKLLIS